MSHTTRLITFLGTGTYQPTCYQWPGHDGEVTTRFVAQAVAQLGGATEIAICATAQAEAINGAAVLECFTSAGLPAPTLVRLGDGKARDELWQSFGVLADLLTPGAAEQFILDITHGFRSQPFFAGAVVSFVRALLETPASIEVVYGAFEARSEDNRTPIWNLTSFADLVDLTHGIRQFLRTGDAGTIAEQVDAVARTLGRRWAEGGKRGPPPRLQPFAKALRRFGDALVTVRTGELLLSQGGKPSAALELATAVRRAKEELAVQVPPLARVLDKMYAMTEGLHVEEDHLAGSQGSHAAAALARLYWRLGRYADAAITLREAWVSINATRSGARPGCADFGGDERKRAEARWQREHGESAKRIARVRNDIQHGGFRRDPSRPTSIRSELKDLIQDFGQPREATPAPGGATYFVTRHTGARDWMARRGVQVDHVVEHLDATQLEPGDTVIGTLPVNLAAAVCERGARFLSLALDLPGPLRGKELSADELEQCGARLEEYRIERVSAGA